MNPELLNRWRLVLGRYAADGLGLADRDFPYAEQDGLLDFLYRREYQNRDVVGEDPDDDLHEGGRGGSRGAPPTLVAVEWVNHVRRLFPREVADKLQHQALDRYGLSELVTDPEVLERMPPDMNLCRHILAFKNLMNEKVLAAARGIVARVVEDLRRRLAAPVERAVMGRRARQGASPVRRARNLDFRRTVARNLAHYDMENERLVLRRVYFHANVRRQIPWELVLLVDESGSMMDSVIHAAVMAGIFAGLPIVRLKLVLFDDRVVDLSDHADDPVETLMKVQLGGGTDIGSALAYGLTLLESPRRSLTVLISDLCDGRGYLPMYRAARELIEAGSRLLCLTALDADGKAVHDRTAAKRFAALGARVASLTPYQLAEWVGDAVRE